MEIQHQYYLKEQIYNCRLVNVDWQPVLPQNLFLKVDGNLIDLEVPICETNDSFCFLADFSYDMRFYLDQHSSKRYLNDFNGLVDFDNTIRVQYAYNLKEKAYNGYISINNCKDINLCELNNVSLYLSLDGRQPEGNCNSNPNCYLLNPDCNSINSNPNNIDPDCDSCGFTYNGYDLLVLQPDLVSDLFIILDNKSSFIRSKLCYDSNQAFVYNNDTIIHAVYLYYTGFKLNTEKTNLLVDVLPYCSNCHDYINTSYNSCSFKYHYTYPRENITLMYGVDNLVAVFDNSTYQLLDLYIVKPLNPYDSLSRDVVTNDSYNLLPSALATYDHVNNPDLVNNLVTINEEFFKIIENDTKNRLKLEAIEDSTMVLMASLFANCINCRVKPNTYYTFSCNITLRKKLVKWSYYVKELDAVGNLVNEQLCVSQDSSKSPVKGFYFKTGSTTAYIQIMVKIIDNVSKGMVFELGSFMMKEGMPNIYQSAKNNTTVCEHFFLQDIESYNLKIEMGYPDIDNIPKLRATETAYSLANGSRFDGLSFAPVDISIPCKPLGESNDEKLANFNLFVDEYVTPNIINDETVLNQFYMRYDNSKIYDVFLNDVIKYDLNDDFKYTLSFLAPKGEYYNMNLLNEYYQDSLNTDTDYSKGLVQNNYYLKPIIEFEVTIQSGESLDLTIEETVNGQKLYLKGYQPPVNDPNRYITYNLVYNSITRQVWIFNYDYDLLEEITDKLDVMIGKFEFYYSYNIECDDQNFKIVKPVYGLQKPLYLLL
ncbi:MAG: hypothetical protein CfClM3_0605 [Methanobrevibacter sp. CfCl-M3]